jgi:hypothetical protein
MAIIDELEPVRRGLYGGAVGYFAFGGTMDTAIAIRTSSCATGRAYIQAGRPASSRTPIPSRASGVREQGARRVIQAIRLWRRTL